MDIVDKIQKQSRLRYIEKKKPVKPAKVKKTKFENERVRKLYQKKYNKARSKKRKELLKEKVKSQSEIQKQNERLEKQKAAADRVHKLAGSIIDDQYTKSIIFKYTMAEPAILDGEEGLLCNTFGCGKKLSMIEKMAGRVCTGCMKNVRNPFA